MKKLVLMAVAAIVAVSFASCGNKAANAEQAAADSIRIAPVEATAAEAAATMEVEAAAEAVDSVAVVAE